MHITGEIHQVGGGQLTAPEDAADYRRSLELLLALEADVLCEGHYGIYRGNPAVAAFIRQFL
jgi:glyoxylase-like metal-dependent hydrolase (beta-lactamase superfamily II)